MDSAIFFAEKIDWSDCTDIVGLSFAIVISRSSLFSRFDTWLVTGIDVNHGGIKIDSALIEHNENAEMVCVDPVNRNDNGFTAILVQRPACSKEESFEIVARRNIVFGGWRFS
jgi:hypothetical protein